MSEDVSIIGNQIGCGYCHKEKTCLIRDPKINKAKLGCNEWIHWTKVKSENKNKKQK